MSSNVKVNGNEADMVHEISDDSDDSDVEMQEDEETTENAVVEMTEEQKIKIAEFKKAQGNEHYKKKSYAAALNLYTEAIDLCPTCSAYYGNRSATFIMMSQYGKALEDARRSVLLDPTFVKGHLREAKCHLAMGEPPAACRSYEIALQLEPENNIAKHELQQARHVRDYQIQAEKSYSEGDYRRVVYCMDKSIELSPACRKFSIAKAECLALLKRYQESQDIVNDILRFEGMNAEALYVRGLCLYYLDNIDKAFQHFQQVLRLAPDLQKAKNVYRQAKSLLQKKEEGNQAFRATKFPEAYDTYTEALAIDPNNIFVNSKLYCNRALVLVKLERTDDAIADCTKAIELDSNYTKAILRRAKCYTDAEQYEEAVRDYETLHKLDKTRENKASLQEAKLALKKSKRKDYYKILGISKSATDDEIKKAYKKSALKYHPDRHANASDETKKEQEKKFKEVGEAYTVLSDAKKKARYDSGQDLEEFDGAGFNDIDPNQIFQAFFGAPGGGYSFQQSGYSGGGGAQFPGGFSFQFG